MNRAEVARQESFRFDAGPALPPQLIDLKTFCERTMTSDSVARQWVAEGRLKAFSPNGKTLRIPVTEISRLFQPVPVGDERKWDRPRPGTSKNGERP